MRNYTYNLILLLSVPTSDNIPNSGYDESSSVMYIFLWYPRQVQNKHMKPYWQPGKEGMQQRYIENLWGG